MTAANVKLHGRDCNTTPFQLQQPFDKETDMEATQIAGFISTILLLALAATA